MEWVEASWLEQNSVESRALPAAAAASVAECMLSIGEGFEAAAVVREVFGNPFRPVTIDPVWLSWNDGPVQKIAQAIYEERAFDRMPILADALEDAGCTEQAILAHCRGDGPHVRGCWVVDLLLGKQ
jgi:hypothetical protein